MKNFHYKDIGQHGPNHKPKDTTENLVSKLKPPKNRASDFHRRKRKSITLVRSKLHPAK
jgi:hypothetical protein